VDAVQSVDRIPLDLRSIPIDLLSFSGHKLHAPKGIGVLYIRRGVHCAPLILGGNQENGRRSGTENTPGIAGLHAALGVSAERATRPGVYLKALRSVFLDSLEEALPDTEILGPVGDGAAPHIVAVGVEGAKAEVILHMLEQDRIYVSTGSACSSRANSQSHVLQAMHVPARIADGTLRFSFSVLNTEEEIRTAVERLALHVKRVRRLMRR
jgi:cysteine desulfurase